MAEASVSPVVSQSNRGKPKIFFNGFSYIVDRERNGHIYYKCSDSCGGRAKGNDPSHRTITETKPHNHQPDSGAVEVAIAVSTMKKRAREETLPISKIYVQEVDKLLDKGIGFVTQVPQHSQVKSSLYQNRLDQFGAKIPKTMKDIQLIDEWTQTIDGERFLLLDEEYEIVKTVNKVRTKYPGRLILYASHRFLERCSEFEGFFLDGTFFSSPKMFAQNYSMHGVFPDRDLRDGETSVSVPVVWGYLPDKTHSTYLRMFSAIKDYLVKHNIPINASWAKFDFETGAISAFREVFPDITVQGCYFHYSNALVTNMKNHGILKVKT